MPNYSLSKSNGAFLNIEIEKKNYKIPLANSLKLKELRKLIKANKLESEEEQLEFLMDFFGKYLGEDTIGELTISQIYELFTLWQKANEEAGGISLGESSAS